MSVGVPGRRPLLPRLGTSQRSFRSSRISHREPHTDTSATFDCESSPTTTTTLLLLLLLCRPHKQPPGLTSLSPALLPPLDHKRSLRTANPPFLPPLLQLRKRSLCGKLQGSLGGPPAPADRRRSQSTPAAPVTRSTAMAPQQQQLPAECSRLMGHQIPASRPDATHNRFVDLYSADGFTLTFASMQDVSPHPCDTAPRSAHARASHRSTV